MNDYEEELYDKIDTLREVIIELECDEDAFESKDMDYSALICREAYEELSSVMHDYECELEEYEEKEKKKWD